MNLNYNPCKLSFRGGGLTLKIRDVLHCHINSCSFNCLSVWICFNGSIPYDSDRIIHCISYRDVWPQHRLSRAGAFQHIIISLHSGMSRAVHPQDFSKVDVDQEHIPVWVSHSIFPFL